MEPWPPSVLWEGVEERLSPALEVECVTVSWGFTSVELQSTTEKTMALGPACVYEQRSSTTESVISQVDQQKDCYAWMHKFKHLLKNPLSSSSLSPPEHQSAPLYGCLLSATHILFTLLLSVQKNTHTHTHTFQRA